MSVQGIRAGKAFVEFLIDDKKLDSGLLKVADKLKKFGAIGLAAAGPVVAGFAACAAVFANVGSELADMSARTGVSVESLSQLSFAAKQTGTDMGAVEKAMKALQGKGIDPQKFDQIAADLAAIPNHTARAQKAIDVFGAKVGVALLPMLDQLPQLRAEADRLNLTISGPSAAAADRLGDAWDSSKQQMTALMFQIGAAIAGPLTDFLTWSQTVVANVITWIQENPRLVQTLAVVAGAIAGVAAAAMFFGSILTVITLHPIVAGLALIAGGIAAVATYFGLASDGATDFNQKLETLKQSTPGQQSFSDAGGQAFRQQAHAGLVASQGQAVQQQLQSLQMGRQLSGPISSQAVDAVNKEMSAYLKALVTAAGQELAVLKDIRTLLRLPGFANAMGLGLLVTGD